MLKNLIMKGSSLGVAIHELREQRKLPLNPTDLTAQYKLISKGKIDVRTNASGNFEVACGPGAKWLVRREDGLTRLVDCSTAEAQDAITVFKNVDFSRPISGSNTPSTEPGLAAELVEASDMIWNSHPKVSSK
jgi:hypothetical protein